MKRIEVAPGAHLNILPAEKFNRCRITVQLRYKACRETATALALVPFLLERGYAECPDMTALSRRLAKLYGASLSVDTTASGASRALTVSVDGIQQRFALGEENLAAEYVELALGVAFRPYLANGTFDAEAVEIEKKKLAEELAGEINDKRVYCVRQARRRFFGDAPAGLERGGYPEEVEGLTPAAVTAAYQRMVRCAQVEVFCAGLEEAKVTDCLTRQLDKLDRAPAPLPETAFLPPQPAQHFTEAMEMVQAKLCMLFTIKEFDPCAELSAMRVAMAVLGGSPTSRLFMNVREKQSLCYYCAASFNSFAGVMCIDSGIEPENAGRAEEAILQEWRALCSTPVDQKELDDAVRFTSNSLAAVNDGVCAQETWYIGQLWRGTTTTPDEVQRELAAVSAAQVQRMMQKFEFSVSYLLTAEGDEEGE